VGLVEEAGQRRADIVHGVGGDADLEVLPVVVAGQPDGLGDPAHDGLGLVQHLAVDLHHGHLAERGGGLDGGPVRLLDSHVLEVLAGVGEDEPQGLAQGGDVEVSDFVVLASHFAATKDSGSCER